MHECEILRQSMTSIAVQIFNRRPCSHCATLFTFLSRSDTRSKARQERRPDSPKYIIDELMRARARAREISGMQLRMLHYRDILLSRGAFALRDAEQFLTSNERSEKDAFIHNVTFSLRSSMEHEASCSEEIDDGDGEGKRPR